MCSYCGCRNIPMIATLNAEPAQRSAGSCIRIPAGAGPDVRRFDREENRLFPAALAFLDDAQWDGIQRPELMGADNPTAGGAGSHQ
jgi:hypothetical protein